MARKVRESIIDMGQNIGRYGKVGFPIPEKGRRREILFCRGEEKQRMKKRTIFGEGKYFFGEGKEKEDNFWRRKVLFCGGEGNGGQF